MNNKPESLAVGDSVYVDAKKLSATIDMLRRYQRDIWFWRALAIVMIVLYIWKGCSDG